MAPRRRKKMMSLKGRVAVIASQAQWDQMQRKCTNKYILVHFGAAWCVPCKKMKPIFSEFSRKNEYKMITFAECDVDKLPDVATLAGVKTLPTFAMFYNGEAVETASGGTPMKVVELLQKYSGLARENGASQGGGLRSILVTSLLATAAVAAGVLGFLWKTDRLPWADQADTHGYQSGEKVKPRSSAKSAASGSGVAASAQQSSSLTDMDSEDSYGDVDDYDSDVDDDYGDDSDDDDTDEE